MEESKDELLEQLTTLKAGYVAILNELDVMNNWGRVHLEALYATKIGKFKVEVLELQIALKAIKKKIQLCFQYINRGEEPDFDEIEEKVFFLLIEAEGEVLEAKSKVVLGRRVLSNLASPERSMELRKIFRSVAKNLHPDVNPNLTASQTEIWHTFLNAYKEGDLERLKSLQIVYADEIRKIDSVEQQLTVDDISLQIASLKQGIIELEEQKKELSSQFPFNIAEQIRDDEWVLEQQDLIAEDKRILNEQLTSKTKEYELIRAAYE